MQRRKQAKARKRKKKKQKRQAKKAKSATFLAGLIGSRVRPEAVSILGQTFRIEYAELDEDTYGETKGTEYTIYIQKSLRGKVLKSTLLHEIMHAIIFVSGMSERLAIKDEEALVTALEHGLIDLVQLRKVRTNPVS